MADTALTSSAFLEHTEEHVHIQFSVPHRLLSSAVLNGGIVEADHLVNLRVPQHGEPEESPEQTIADYCRYNKWEGSIVGVMTAAPMDTLRVVKRTVQNIDIIVLVTAGLSNPRRAGDRAEHREMTTESNKTGTINIVILTSAVLTGAALAEAVIVATEAKSAALQDAGVISPVSERIATGTGTDAVAVVSGNGPETVRYCGKHVLFGEILANAVIEAVTSSID